MTVLKQFNLARTALLTYIRELDEETVDDRSSYFENTIRWHIGNVLVVDEKFLFVSQKNAQKLPAEYASLFSSDVKVSDWTTQPPTLEQLLADLEDQQNRINSFEELFWKSDVKFKVPNGHIETHGDLLIMLAHREAETLGLIKAMKQVSDQDNGK